MPAEKLTKNEKREQAREQARIRREEELKRKKRKSLFIKLGVLGGVLALISVVVLVITAPQPTPVLQSNPKNMISNGVLFDGSSVPVETPAISKGAKATPTVPSADKVNVAVYLDYACPYCKKFEELQSGTLKQYVERGQVALEYHPIGFLSTYSGIAANASACVAANEPEKWWEANDKLYANQLDEAVAQTYSKKLSVKHIKDAWKDLNLNSETSKCISDTPYIDWVANATSDALNGPLPNSDAPKVEGTPFVIVDGKFYRVDYIQDPQALTKVIDSALAAKKQ